MLAEKILKLIKPVLRLNNINMNIVDVGLLGCNALKMEAICSSETLVSTYKPTLPYNPEDPKTCS
jgi:hypothetical protein